MRVHGGTGSLLVLAALLGAGCGDSKYAQAGVGTAAAVAAVGLNRAVTGDCWGRCQAGYLCNQESGLCERGECMPPCATGSHCTRGPTGELACAPDPATLRYGSRRPPAKTPASPAGAGKDGGAEAGSDGG